MKTTVFIIVSVLFALQSYAQRDSSLLGSWKVIALSNEEIYYDLTKDSLFVSKAIEKEIGSIEEKKRFKESLFSVFNGVDFHFETNGLFKQTLKGKLVFDGIYQILPQQRILEFKTKNEEGELITSKIAFEIKNNRLYLFIKSDEKLFDFLLEKN